MLVVLEENSKYHQRYKGPSSGHHEMFYWINENTELPVVLVAANADKLYLNGASLSYNL